MRTFVLDTNVLLHDPRSIFSFGTNKVVVPIYVIEELDQFKKDMSELGRNAREVARIIDDLREKGDIAKGVKLPNKGTFVVLAAKKNIPTGMANANLMDNKILSVAVEQKGQVTFVTKDVNLRIRSDALSLKSEDYEPSKVDVSDLPTGLTIMKELDDNLDSVQLNEFVLGPDGRHIRQRKTNGFMTVNLKETWGISSRNVEQACLLDLLTNDSIPLVAVVGKAGTGKTLLSIAAGLTKVTEEQKYSRLLVSRPVVPMGKDIGYLPGTLEEKLGPWMQPIADNVDFLLNSKANKRNTKNYQTLVDLGLIELGALTYIRGRSIPNQFMLIDEAQNLTPHELKTIITRAGEGTKIVLTGDPYQIDNPYIDSTNNGLVYVVNKFRGHPLFGHITLTKGERSPLAEAASNLL